MNADYQQQECRSRITYGVPGTPREIARIALERGTGARGLRSVVEEVLEGVLFDPEPGARYVITERTVRGGEPVKQSLSQRRAPLSARLLKRLDARSPISPVIE